MAWALRGEVFTAWLMICPKSPRNKDGTGKSPTEEEIREELKDDQRLAELRGRLSNRSCLTRQLSQHRGIRCNGENKMRGHFWAIWRPADRI